MASNLRRCITCAREFSPTPKRKLACSLKCWYGRKATEITREFILSHIEITINGCWEWMGQISSHGYALLNKTYMHRESYSLWHKTIPDNLQIDHLCRNTKCINPSHLEAVTQRENLLRGATITAINASKTHCINGHEFTPENIWIRTGKGGGRCCRECSRIRTRETKLRRLIKYG